MLDTGSVRSMSDAVSRPRTRPAAMPVGSSTNERSLPSVSVTVARTVSLPRSANCHWRATYAPSPSIPTVDPERMRATAAATLSSTAGGVGCVRERPGRSGVVVPSSVAAG